MAMVREHVAQYQAQPPEGPAPKRWTVDEYLQLHELGVFDEQTRTELLDGVIYVMAGMKSPHYISLMKCSKLFNARVSDAYSVGVQMPIHLSDYSEPEPDLSVIRASIEEIASFGKPKADQIALIIEVADSSFDFDDGKKKKRYARSGIPEYWIVDLNTASVHRHTKPTVKGKYESHEIFATGEAIASTELGIVQVRDLLP